MFIVANLIDALAQVLYMVLSLYTWVLVIRALISWVNPDPYNPIVQFLHRATEPVLNPVRRIVGLPMGMDFSILIVILSIVFLQNFLVSSLRQLARQMY